jgi:hypothetical protein
VNRWSLELTHLQILLFEFAGVLHYKLELMSTIEITKFLDIEAKVDDESEDDSFESEGDYGTYFDSTSDSP